jgi:hypothetical protein
VRIVRKSVYACRSSRADVQGPTGRRDRRGRRCRQDAERRERPRQLTARPVEFRVARVDRRQRVGEPPLVRRRHDRPRPWPPVGTDQLPGGRERREVPPGVAPVAARAPLDRRQKAIRLIVANLLHVDPRRRREVDRPQIRLLGHHKPASSFCDFPDHLGWGPVYRPSPTLNKDISVLQ